MTAAPPVELEQDAVETALDDVAIDIEDIEIDDDNMLGLPTWDEIAPDISDIEIEDDAPVDSIETEKQQRLLTEPLYSSWPGPGAARPFLAAANVGIFYQQGRPPVVPDVMLSLDVEVAQDMNDKHNRTYFVWVFGKVPELVIEIVSNRKGGELGSKRKKYARVGSWYYVVFDPTRFLRGEALTVYELHKSEYVTRTDYFFPELGLGLKLWPGTYEGLTMEWLRWCYEDGTLLPTGKESALIEAQRADTEQQRADVAEQQRNAEQQRADTEQQRAERFAAKLRELGIDPNSL